MGEPACTLVRARGAIAAPPVPDRPRGPGVGPESLGIAVLLEAKNG